MQSTQTWRDYTVIQLRRFMLLFVDVDFCASAMDVKLNSYPFCKFDTFLEGLEIVVPIGSCSEMLQQDSLAAFQSKIAIHCFHA